MNARAPLVLGLPTHRDAPHHSEGGRLLLVGHRMDEQRKKERSPDRIERSGYARFLWHVEIRTRGATCYFHEMQSWRSP